MGQLKRNITQGNQFVAVSFSGSAENPLYYVVQAKVVKGELNIVNAQNFEELDIDTLGKGQLHLNINNHQVLQKKLPKTEASNEALVQQAFSNIQIDDFYYELLHTTEAIIVCMCRKEYINGLIAQYAKENKIVTQWSLGPLCIEQLLPFMDTVDSIDIPEHRLRINEDRITSIEKRISMVLETNYAIENMQVSNEYLIPFSGVLRSFIQFDSEGISNYASELGKQQGLFKEHRLYALGLPVAIGFLFVIFFVNFMFYNFYYQEVDRLEQITQVNTMQRKVLIEKDSIVGQKKKLFDDVIASASSSASLFVDEMIAAMPEGLILDQINYQPVLRKIRKKKPILIAQNQMLIGGKTRDNMALTHWISDLEDLSFVQEATLRVDTNGSTTQFEIAVTLESL